MCSEENNKLGSASTPARLSILAYSPKWMHKLLSKDTARLITLGFTCLPGTHQEFRSLDHGRALIRRHHVVPRQGWFNPAFCKDLPVPLAWLGNLRHASRTFSDGEEQQVFHWWRHGSPPGTKLRWTGVSTFQICMPIPAPRELGGDPIQFRKHQVTQRQVPRYEGQVQQHQVPRCKVQGARCR